MSIKVNIVNVPRTDEAIQEGAIKLLKAAEAVGLRVDPHGFATAWMSDNTRMAIATDGDAAVAAHRQDGGGVEDVGIAAGVHSGSGIGADGPRDGAGRHAPAPRMRRRCAGFE